MFEMDGNWMAGVMKMLGGGLQNWERKGSCVFEGGSHK